MTTSQDRKAASEALLRERGVPINAHLPLIESDEDVVLRSDEELLHRLIGLWAVVGSAFLRGNTHFREYIVTRGIESWLSSRELEFLLDDDRSEDDYIQYSWRLECLYFLAWCAGLIEGIQLPTSQSSVESIMHLFPSKMEPPDRLKEAIRVRARSEVMVWADLLYRLHWAIRNARLTGSSQPVGIEGGVIQEWHLAVNWMTRYENENDWDHVGTDT